MTLDDGLSDVVRVGNVVLDRQSAGSYLSDFDGFAQAGVNREENLRTWTAWFRIVGEQVMWVNGCGDPTAAADALTKKLSAHRERLQSWGL